MELQVMLLLAALLPFATPRPDVRIRWCAVKGKEIKKCNSWSEQEKAGRLICIEGQDSKDCYKLIAQHKADMASFDGGDIYDAGRLYGLKPIMSETLKDSPDDFSSYYAVAVVKAKDKWTIDNLKGRASSCHTGVKKTSGWNAPIAYLVKSGKMQIKNCNIFQSVADFFSGSCAPGVNNSDYNPGLIAADKLCSKCIGDGKGKSRCERNSNELYYGYQGAWRCLKEGAGDVAFIKHSIPLEMPKISQGKYRLLCEDGTRKHPSEYMNCYLAKAPAHAVMTSGKMTNRKITEYQRFLQEAHESHGVEGKGGFWLYKDGHLFSSSTVRLTALPPSKQNYTTYLDSSYLGIMKLTIPKC